MEQLLGELGRPWAAVVHATPFELTLKGPFPERTWRRILLDFFPIIEAFPKYMGITLAKTTFGQRPRDFLARDWLIGNIRVEAAHARWYIDWATAYGITVEELCQHRPSPEVAALYEWQWSIAHRGTLAESIGAINYAIEGTTGDWCKRLMSTFAQHLGEGSGATTWLRAHAKYDDMHPVEALEIIKLSVESPAEVVRVGSAIRRSLELFALALEACVAPEEAYSAVA